MKQSVDKASRRAQLEKEGWKKQTTYDEPRLSELVGMYREMGLEVRLEEPDHDDGCTACYDASAGKLKTIYTREKKAQGTRRKAHRRRPARGRSSRPKRPKVAYGGTKGQG